MWTRFMDMHSGGDLKEKWQYIYIEAPEQEAKIIFQNRFGHNPERVMCTCCGADYSVDESPTLEQATGYDRNCPYIYKQYHRRGKYFSHGRYLEKGETVPRGYKLDEDFPSRRRKPQSTKTFLRRKDVRIIRQRQIKPSERRGTLRTQGYVWTDGD